MYIAARYEQILMAFSAPTSANQYDIYAYMHLSIYLSIYLCVCVGIAARYEPILMAFSAQTSANQ